MPQIMVQDFPVRQRLASEGEELRFIKDGSLSQRSTVPSPTWACFTASSMSSAAIVCSSLQVNLSPCPAMCLRFRGRRPCHKSSLGSATERHSEAQPRSLLQLLLQKCCKKCLIKLVHNRGLTSALPSGIRIVRNLVRLVERFVNT